MAAGHIIRATDAAHDLTVFTVVGAVDAVAVSGHIMAFLPVDPPPLVLWDLRAGTVTGLSIVDVIWIIKRAEPFADRSKFPLVIGRAAEYAEYRMLLRAR